MTGIQPLLNRIQRCALIAGAAALACCALGAPRNPQRFLEAYLVGYLFWTGIALGCAALLMLHHLVGGGWGVAIRRLLESGTRTFPLAAVLALPVLLGLPYLYVWARPDAVTRDASLRHKQPYLNVPFFAARTAVYFAVWLALAWALNRWSAEEDRTGSPAARARLRKLSAPGLILYGFTATFASVDWVMSLEPHWYSTVYGVLFIVGQALATLAFAIAALLVVGTRPPLSETLTPQHLHDLGNLTLAFVMLWAYVAFSQFLIIWSGNLPEEIPWYLARMRGGWGVVAAGLILFHFLVPFLLLLSRQNKRRLRTLGSLAAAMLALRLVDLYWMVAPAFHRPGLAVHWMDLAAPLGVGGLWVAAFVWQLKRRPLGPAGSARMV